MSEPALYARAERSAARLSWLALSGEGELRVPDAADLFSLVPIAALPPLIARMTGAEGWSR